MSNTPRVTEIYALPEARDRPALAGFLAMQTKYSTEAVKLILAAAPKDQTQSQQAGQNDDDASAVLQLARDVGLKGFARADSPR